MAKIKGPLMSASASGSIGECLTFSQRKSGQQARFQKSQKDIITSGRVTARLNYTNAVFAWNLLTTPERAVYIDRAKFLYMTGFNLFMKENIGVPAGGSFSQGPFSPGTVVQDNSTGHTNWNFLNRAMVADDNPAFTYYLSSELPYSENSIKIVKGGSIQGEDKSTGASVNDFYSYVSYGADDNLWGLSFNSSDINSVDFGFVASWKGNLDVSTYLKAINFGFSIPAGAVIDGIVFEIRQRWNGPDFEVDHVRATVFYTI